MSFIRKTSVIILAVTLIVSMFAVAAAADDETTAINEDVSVAVTSPEEGLSTATATTDFEETAVADDEENADTSEISDEPLLGAAAPAEDTYDEENADDIASGINTLGTGSDDTAEEEGASETTAADTTAAETTADAAETAENGTWNLISKILGYFFAIAIPVAAIIVVVAFIPNGPFARKKKKK